MNRGDQLDWRLPVKYRGHRCVNMNQHYLGFVDTRGNEHQHLVERACVHAGIHRHDSPELHYRYDKTRAAEQPGLAKAAPQPEDK